MEAVSASGDNDMRLALYQPDIPQNTGSILRTAACLAIPVDVIGPAGFDLSDRALRRSRLDYIGHASLRRHQSWDDYVAWLRQPAPSPRIVLLTTRASLRYTDFAFAPSDVLLFGRESAGVPDHVHAAADARLVIPLAAGMRSLNVAVAAAMVAAEALRQTDGFPA